LCADLRDEAGGNRRTNWEDCPPPAEPSLAVAQSKATGHLLPRYAPPPKAFTFVTVRASSPSRSRRSSRALVTVWLSYVLREAASLPLVGGIIGKEWFCRSTPVDAAGNERATAPAGEVSWCGKTAPKIGTVHARTNRSCERQPCRKASTNFGSHANSTRLLVAHILCPKNSERKGRPYVTNPPGYPAESNGADYRLSNGHQVKLHGRVLLLGFLG